MILPRKSRRPRPIPHSSAKKKIVSFFLLSPLSTFLTKTDCIQKHISASAFLSGRSEKPDLHTLKMLRTVAALVVAGTFVSVDAFTAAPGLAVRSGVPAHASALAGHKLSLRR